MRYRKKVCRVKHDTWYFYRCGCVMSLRLCCHQQNHWGPLSLGSANRGACVALRPLSWDARKEIGPNNPPFCQLITAVQKDCEPLPRWCSAATQAPCSALCPGGGGGPVPTVKSSAACRPQQQPAELVTVLWLSLYKPTLITYCRLLLSKIILWSINSEIISAKSVGHKLDDFRYAL